ncbi:hypothetical protein LOTGIDRAFT_153114 [Lottia gigantea]|uniref:Uncharacterized protein n=1 Tax=Lottia gigantea TaxID=225164 RepID=V4BX68_LOTGI|nr:hypothetical protein LOTGIDRAFT_153114 [Lottia gigantea]ESO93664.1 hypothetical protein LOTGIDRAFT_153114 [Lottia gigantea]
MEEGESLQDHGNDTQEEILSKSEDKVTTEISNVSEEGVEAIAENDNLENKITARDADPEIVESNRPTQEAEDTSERSCDSRGDVVERQISLSSSGNQSPQETRSETQDLETSAVTDSDLVKLGETEQNLETQNYENLDSDLVQSDKIEQNLETQNNENSPTVDEVDHGSIQFDENIQDSSEVQISAEDIETVDPSNNLEQNHNENETKNEDVILPANERSDNVETNELKDEDLGVYMDDDMDSNISEENSKRPLSSIRGRPVSAKIQSRTSSKRPESRIQFKEPERTEIEDVENIADQRVKVNTPVSHAADLDNRRLESREATYEQAMNLLSKRCTSSQHDINNQYSPEYFYIHQTKPTPMPPLKAWRGYHGNVYFEPITINSLQNQPVSPTSPVERCQNKNHQLLVSRSRMASRNSLKSRLSNKSIVKSRPVTQQVVILDKNTVLNRLDEISPQELAWLNGQDSTGSLSLRPQTVGSVRRPASSRYDRICKGSVSGKLRQSALLRNEPPKINVNGDRFVHPSALSPLLRSTTQYSLSNQRTLNSSPDLYHSHHGNFDHLPPMEQVRVSLRHVDNSLDNYGRTSPYIRARKYTDELKPFIKYSPEIKAKYSRKLNGVL